MYEAMAWLEGSALAETLRDLGVWTYAVINLVHVLGIGLLFGTVVLLDLRLVGLWRNVPVAAVAGPAVRVAAAGFLLAAASGIMMLSFNATEYHGNPFLYVKLPMILVALVSVGVVSRLPAWRRARNGLAAEPRDRKVLPVIGIVSLSTWLVVIACGRMIGYY